MKIPSYLKQGDKIAFTCPAKQFMASLDAALKLVEEWGLQAVIGQTIGQTHGYFAGTDQQRVADLQNLLDDDSVKAIWAVQGGYGTVRLIDNLNYGNFINKPKWIIGFSDITALHSHINAVYNIATMHAITASDMNDTGIKASEDAIRSLKKALFGEKLSYSIAPNQFNIKGESEGELTGGNLSVLLSISGSVSEYNYRDKILFIEDIGEKLYNIDRLLWQMERSGKLRHLKGIIVGIFKGISDTQPPFGLQLEEVIRAHALKYDFPAIFNFPAGHISDNHAMVLGKRVKISVTDYGSKVVYMN